MQSNMQDTCSVFHSPPPNIYSSSCPSHETWRQPPLISVYCCSTARSSRKENVLAPGCDAEACLSLSVMTRTLTAVSSRSETKKQEAAETEGRTRWQQESWLDITFVTQCEGEKNKDRQDQCVDVRVNLTWWHVENLQLRERLCKRKHHITSGSAQ